MTRTLFDTHFKTIDDKRRATRVMGDDGGEARGESFDPNATPLLELEGIWGLKESAWEESNDLRIQRSGETGETLGPAVRPEMAWRENAVVTPYAKAKGTPDPETSPRAMAKATTAAPFTPYPPSSQRSPTSHASSPRSPPSHLRDLATVNAVHQGRSPPVSPEARTRALRSPRFPGAPHSTPTATSHYLPRNTISSPRHRAAPIAFTSTILDAPTPCLASRHGWTRPPRSPTATGANARFERTLVEEAHRRVSSTPRGRHAAHGVTTPSSSPRRRGDAQRGPDKGYHNLVHSHVGLLALGDYHLLSQQQHESPRGLMLRGRA